MTNKEYIEAFGRIASHVEYDNDSPYDALCLENDYKLVDEALERLEQIDNAEPSEALECLEKLATHRIEYREAFEFGFTKTMPFKSTIEFNAIKQALLKAQIEHKALDIIKEKCVDVFRIKYYITSNKINELEEYKRDRNLADEELELLKEVLE